MFTTGCDEEQFPCREVQRREEMPAAWTLQVKSLLLWGKLGESQATANGIPDYTQDNKPT
jgi:hypothetical protein